MESGNLISKVKEEKNKLKSASKYENIKADYFLEKKLIFRREKKIKYYKI